MIKKKGIVPFFSYLSERLMKKIIYIAFILLLSGICHAQGWTPAITVTGTFTEGKTDLIVAYTDDGTVHTTGCSANNWVFAADTEDRRNRGYSTLMAAVASGKKIKFWYTDTCSAWSYHEATAVMLTNE